MPSRKRSRRRCEDEEEKDDEDTSLVRQCRNRVYFHAEVTQETILDLVTKLEEACVHCLTNGCERIFLFIHSGGGDAYAGLSGMDHIKSSRVPIVCVADGFVASAATFLLMGGRERQAMAHSSVLIHQVSTGFWGKYAELEDEYKNSEQLMTTLLHLYSTHTNLSQKKLDRILKKELTMTAQQCLDCGLVQCLHTGAP